MPKKKLTEAEAQNLVANIENNLKELIWPGDSMPVFSEDPETRKMQQIVLYYRLRSMSNSTYTESASDKDKQNNHKLQKNLINKVLNRTDQLIAFMERNPQFKDECLKELSEANGNRIKRDGEVASLESTTLSTALRIRTNYTRSLFAAEVDTQDDRMQYFATKDNGGVLPGTQKTIITQKISVPKGLKPSDVSALVMACTLDRDIIQATAKKMEEEELSSNPAAGQEKGLGETSITRYNRAITSMFQGIMADADRYNEHLIRIFVPDARTNAMSILSKYERGNKQPMADTLSNAVRDIIRYCKETAVRDNPYYNGAESLVEIMDVLDREEFAGLCRFSAEEQNWIKSIRGEIAFLKETEALETKIRQQIYDLGVSGNKGKIGDNESLKKDIQQLHKNKWITAQTNNVLDIRSGAIIYEMDPKTKEIFYQNRGMTSIEYFYAEKTDELQKIIDDHIEKKLAENTEYNNFLNLSIESVSNNIGLLKKALPKKNDPQEVHCREYEKFEKLSIPFIADYFVKQCSDPTVTLSGITKAELKDITEDLKKLIAPSKRLKNNATNEEIQTRIDSYKEFLNKLNDHIGKLTVKKKDNLSEKAEDVDIIAKMHNDIAAVLKNYERGLGSALNEALDKYAAKKQFLAMDQSQKNDYSYYKDGTQLSGEDAYNLMESGQTIDVHQIPKNGDFGTVCTVSLKGSQVRGTATDIIIKQSEKFDYQLADGTQPVDGKKAIEILKNGKECSLLKFAKGQPLGVLTDFKRSGNGFTEGKKAIPRTRITNMAEGLDHDFKSSDQLEKMKMVRNILVKSDPLYVKNSPQFNNALQTLNNVIKNQEAFDKIPEPNVKQMQIMQGLYKDLKAACKNYTTVKNEKLKHRANDSLGTARRDLLESLGTILGNDHLNKMAKNSYEIARQMDKQGKLAEEVSAEITESLKKLSIDRSEENVRAFGESCNRFAQTLTEKKLSGEEYFLAQLDLSKLMTEVCSEAQKPENNISAETNKTMNDFLGKCMDAQRKYRKLPEQPLKAAAEIAQSKKEKQTSEVKLQDFLFSR